MTEFASKCVQRFRRKTNAVGQWGTLAICLALCGCSPIKTVKVDKTVIASHVMDATLEQLVGRIATQYNSVQSLSASVEIATQTGGEHEGQVKQIPTCAGYILLRKPGDLRVLMLVPVIRSSALDMVSDGMNFKLLLSIPLQPKRAITGKDELGTPSKNGIENLRPGIIRDSMLVPAVQPDEFMVLTENSRILTPAAKKKEAVEEPDYDVSVLRTRGDHVLERVRVIHISRVTLEPYEQDIYDHEGRVVTVVKYDRYQKFGETDFPTSIIITRPLDEYQLKIDVTKLTLNGKMSDEEFTLKIPDGIPVRKM